MAVRDDRSDVKQTTAGFRGPLMVQSLTSAKSKFLSLMISKLKKIAEELPEDTKYENIEERSPSEKDDSTNAQESNLHARQHTPKQLNENAQMSGFENKAYYGVHPHFIDPRMNHLLPPQIFNNISSCLEPLEKLPISLALSSVFIGSFQKK